MRVSNTVDRLIEGQEAKRKSMKGMRVLIRSVFPRITLHTLIITQHAAIESNDWSIAAVGGYYTLTPFQRT